MYFQTIYFFLSILNKVLKEEMVSMFNSRYKNGAFWGTVIGTSVGIILTSKVTPMSRKRMMKSARKVKSSLKDGMNSLWN